MSSSSLSTFVREIERNDESVLRIHQVENGDVGVVVWDAGLVLLYYLDKENERQKGEFLRRRTIVELGSGTGVLSICAASRGAFVVATDLQRLVNLMRKNEEENRALIDAADGQLYCVALDWAEELPDELTSRLRSWSAEASLGGSRGDTAAENEGRTQISASTSLSVLTFPDIILCSDCVYYESSVDSLVKTLASLTGPKTLVLISIEDRTSEEKVKARTRFLRGIEKADFQIARVGIEDMDETFRSPDIHILMMKRKQ